MHDTIKKKLQLHTYMDLNYILFLFYFFILISFEYTHEFTLSFYIGFLIIYLYYTLHFLHLINSTRKKIKKT